MVLEKLPVEQAESVVAGRRVDPQEMLARQKQAEFTPWDAFVAALDYMALARASLTKCKDSLAAWRFVELDFSRRFGVVNGIKEAIIQTASASAAAGADMVQMVSGYQSLAIDIFRNIEVRGGPCGVAQYGLG
jgi:hypothetical protein